MWDPQCGDRPLETKAFLVWLLQKLKLLQRMGPSGCLLTGVDAPGPLYVINKLDFVVAQERQAEVATQ
jgi:hypothetical protein